MKTKLLSLIFTTVLLSSISFAQTKVWDFGNDTTNWPLSAGIGNNPIVVDNLGLYPIATNTNFGAVTANTYTFAADGFSSVKRFQLNGGGGAAVGTYLPTQRYLFFDVSGPCTVKVWFRTSSAGARSLFITNGSTLIATAGTDATGASGDPFILTGSVTAAGRIYVYGDQAQNLYKMTVTGATVATSLGTTDFQSESTVNVFSNGNQISIGNVLSSTEVKVYNMNGALVKSLNTDADTSFELLSAGVYIVNVSSAEGQKAVKVAIK